MAVGALWTSWTKTKTSYKNSPSTVRDSIIYDGSSSSRWRNSRYEEVGSMTVLADWLAEHLPNGEISRLAGHLSVSKSAVSSWRLGCAVPGDRHLEGIARYFAADPEEVAALACESRKRPRRKRRGWDDRRPAPREILDYFIQYQERHLGIPPSLREVMEALGLSSTSVARSIVKGMVRDGLLCRVGDGSRCYAVQGGRWLPPEGMPIQQA
jgi:hypothetical protein